MFIDKRCQKKKKKNETNKQRSGFLSTLLSVLCACLLRNLLTDKRVKSKMLRPGVIKAGERGIATSQGQGTVRSSQDF